MTVMHIKEQPLKLAEWEESFSGMLCAWLWHRKQAIVTG